MSRKPEKTVSDVIRALKRIPNQNLPVSSVVALMAEHPELPVVAMVDSEVVADDTCGIWLGSFGKAYIDEVCTAKTNYNEFVTLFRSDGNDENAERLSLFYGEDPIDDTLPEDEIDRIIDEKISLLPWKKSICVFVTLPEA